MCLIDFPMFTLLTHCLFLQIYALVPGVRIREDAEMFQDTAMELNQHIHRQKVKVILSESD